MKKILTGFLFIIINITNASAQDINNFKIENNALFWQKIYETTLSTEAIVKQIKTNGNIKNIDLSETTLTGDMEIPANYKESGFSEMSIPMFIPRNNIVCSVIIDFKENRYRVTLKNIKLKATMEDPITKIGQITTLESFALRRNNTIFTNNFTKYPSQIYNYTFNKIFEIKKEVSDENW